MNLPDPWEHEHGYRVNNDGCQIRYRHPETNVEITVEGALSDDETKLQYIVWVFDKTKSALEYPHIVWDKEHAFELARQKATEYDT